MFASFFYLLQNNTDPHFRFRILNGIAEKP